MFQLWFKRLAQVALMLVMISGLYACNNPQVYGSIGVSSYGKMGNSGRVSGSISIGGRIR
jgi:hypothetical protein